ncbi:MAG: MBL fold metallo-hydrolase [Burkholderiales bacterium]|nr:MBL fold metallo-hydrolase [Burkholderiales bacterium]
MPSAVSGGWRWLRRALALLVLLLVAAAAFVVVQWQRRPDLAAYRQRFELPAASPVPGAASAPGALRVRFAGVATLVFDDGETAWMTDGFFTRPDARTTFTRKIAPDEAEIERQLKLLGVTKLAAVVAVHSHYDHALDSPIVARLTGARLIGSGSTLNVGRGLGLAEGQMQEVRSGQTVTLGPRFKLLFIESRHSPTPYSDGQTVDTIDAPLTPPARTTAWRTGTTWSIVVEHDGRRLLVQGSAGFVPGALRGQNVDTVLLGVGTLAKKNETYRSNYWDEVVRGSGAKRVIAIHWDDFWRRLDDQPLRAMPRLLDDTDASFDELARRAADAKIEFKLPPLRVPFDPWPAAQ